MKKIFLAVLLAIVLVVFSACNEDDGYSYVASDIEGKSTAAADTQDTQKDTEESANSTSEDTNDSGNEDKPISLPTINFN